MKILLADKFPCEHLSALRARGHDCEPRPEVTAEELPMHVDGCEALVVRSTRVTADTLHAGSALELVVRAGAGTNTIDTAEARRRGVRVCNVPGRNAAAVAELTMGLLLAIDRNIPDNVNDLRAGVWNKTRWSKARGLHGCAIGILGVGAIGLAVAERAAAFGMRVHVLEKTGGRDADTERRLAAVGARTVSGLPALAAAVDVLSIHVPASAATRGVVGAQVLAAMRPGAVLLNTSRGDVVDEAALVAALDERGLRAGLDVYAGEPGRGRAEFLSPLASHPSVYGTHHIGASTQQAQLAVADGVLEIFDAWQAGRALHCVNL